jgi:hypothetical protein
MYAHWPLFKPHNLQLALKEYAANPLKMDISKYEDANDTDELPEPLPLAYRDMFKAIKLGCTVEYRRPTDQLYRDILGAKRLIQTSIKLEKMYPGTKTGFHSILIYDVAGDQVKYHDPDRQPSMTCSINHLLDEVRPVGTVGA